VYVGDVSQKLEFEGLLARNRGQLTAISRAYGRGDADDLLQAILLQIWCWMGSFKKRSSIDTWFYRVALNTAISWQRSSWRRNRHLPTESAELDHLPGIADGRDETALLEQLLRTLSEADRALVLMYLEDMSSGEMAAVLGISPEAVRVRIHRLKRRLATWKASDS